MGVFLSYVTPQGHTLIDRELYVPFDWIEDQDRRRAVGIPESIRFQTKPELARLMVERLFQAHLPICWVVADTVYGGNLDLRTWLEEHQYSYVLAVPCHEPVAFQMPMSRRREEATLVEGFVLHDRDWQRLSMSEGIKGPRLFDWAVVPILHRWEDDGRHWLLIRRSTTDPLQKAYYFVCAPHGTTLSEMVKAIGARWHIEEDFENTKDLGLDHYEVRSFVGWYRHITLVLLAAAYLTGICTMTSRLPLSTSSKSPPVLALSRPEVHHLLAHLIWPSSRVRPPSPGMVVVASLSPKCCQLFPHQASSRERRARSASCVWPFPCCASSGGIADSLGFFPEISQGICPWFVV